MVKFKGDASAINQVLKGLHVVDLHPTKIYCNCCAENVERIEFLNASFVPDRTCKNLATRKDDFACSVCECEVVGCMVDDFGSFDNPLLFDYCPKCGAKVIGG